MVLTTRGKHAIIVTENNLGTISYSLKHLLNSWVDEHTLGHALRKACLLFTIKFVYFSTSNRKHQREEMRIST